VGSGHPGTPPGGDHRAVRAGLPASRWSRLPLPGSRAQRTRRALGARQIRPLYPIIATEGPRDHLPVSARTGSWRSSQATRQNRLVGRRRRTGFGPPPRRLTRRTCSPIPPLTPVISRGLTGTRVTAHRPATGRPIRWMDEQVSHVARAAIPCCVDGTLGGRGLAGRWPCSPAIRFAHREAGRTDGRTLRSLWLVTGPVLVRRKHPVAAFRGWRLPGILAAC